MTNTYRLKVDLKLRQSGIIPTFVQYDTARLEFQIFDNGKVFDLSTFTSVEFAHKKPDGSVIVGTGQIETIDGKQIVSYDYQGSEMNNEGVVETSFSLLGDNGKKISVQTFKVKIVTDNRDSALDPANPEYSKLQEYSIQMESLIAQGNDAKELKFINAYNTATAYKKNNTVSFNGESYIAKQANTNKPPTGTIDDPNWAIMARKGADGTGTVVRHKDVFTATAGQTEFTLSKTYDQFQNRIDVTVGNVPQFSPDNFVEAAANKIRFTEGLSAGDRVVVSYFSEAQPLKTDLETQVNGHTSSINNANSLLMQHSTKLTEHTTQLADKAEQEDVQGSLINSFLNINTVKRRNLTQIKAALSAKNATVTFWGDSIVDNGDAVSLFSTFRKVFERMLSDSFRDTSFTYNNRGIGGRTVDHAADPNYVGIATSGPTDSGFLMPWSTVGESWRDNVKATAPDLLVLHFGMNSYSTSKADESYQAIYDFVQTWAKVPTILVIPNFLPNPLWASTWQYRLDTQRTGRYFAEKYNLPSADIGRVHRLLRDGVDELQVVATRKDTELASFGASSATLISNGYDIASGGQIVYNKNMNLLNFELKFKFAYTGVEQFTIPYLRKKYHVRYTPSSGKLQLRNASTLAVISSFVVPVIPNGNHVMTIQVFNSRVVVEVAGQFDKTLTGLTNGIPYTVGIKPLTGSLTVTEISVTELEFNKTTPILTDEDFLGVYDPNDLSIKLPYGGNGVNHPSAKGILTMYQGEFQKFVDAL